MQTIEYRVRPVTRYIVTRYHNGLAGSGVEEMGEYDNEHRASLVASALAESDAGEVRGPNGESIGKVICRDAPGPWEWRVNEGKFDLSSVPVALGVDAPTVDGMGLAMPRA